jgi:hypothetical protein
MDMSGMSIGQGNAGGLKQLHQQRKTEQAQTLPPNQDVKKPHELDKNDKSKEMAASMLNPAQGPKLNLMG